MPRLRNVLVTVVLLATSAVLAGWLIYGPSFAEPELYLTGAEPLDVAVADVDGDGHADVVTANREGRSLSVFRGVGDGTLFPAGEIDTGFGATSLALADIDLDGFPDVVVSGCEPGCQSGALAILAGRGDGRFDAGRVIPVSGVPYNVMVAELNGDGRPDIAATDYPAGLLWVWLSDQGESGFTALPLPTDAKPIALAVADIDDDGNVDLITSDHGAGGSSVYLGYGNGEFSERIDVPTGELPYAIAVGHVDADLLSDLVVAQSTDPGRLIVMQGRGDGTFSIRQEIALEGTPIFVALADLDRDRDLDIVITRQADEFAGAFLNEGDGLFDDVEIPVAAQNKIYSLVVADLDHDAFPDMVTVDFEGGTVGVARGRHPDK